MRNNGKESCRNIRMQMLRIRQDLESWRNQKSSPNMQKNEQVDKEVQWLYLVEKSPPHPASHCSRSSWNLTHSLGSWCSSVPWLMSNCPQLYVLVWGLSFCSREHTTAKCTTGWKCLQKTHEHPDQPLKMMSKSWSINITALLLLA